jgi:Zn-dependent protease
MLLTFACAMLLMTATLYALRGGLVMPGGLRLAGLDAQGIGFGAISVLIAGWYFGPLFGLALVLTVMVHEYGHVAAFRITGRADARFRLVPLADRGGSRWTARRGRKAEAFFVALAGPALSLAPMVLAFVLAEIVDPWSRPLADFLWIFAATTAALNFLNLLPFWPLDGGRCLRAVIHALDPRAAMAATMTMSAAFAAAAVAVGSVLLFLVALVGCATIRPGEDAGPACGRARRRWRLAPTPSRRPPISRAARFCSRSTSDGQTISTSSTSKVRSLPASGWLASRTTFSSVTSATVTGSVRPSPVCTSSCVPGSSGMWSGTSVRGTDCTPSGLRSP